MPPIDKSAHELAAFADFVAKAPPKFCKTGTGGATDTAKFNYSNQAAKISIFPKNDQIFEKSTTESNLTYQ